jgi:hypothetical protein
VTSSSTTFSPLIEAPAWSPGAGLTIYSVAPAVVVKKKNSKQKISFF